MVERKKYKRRSMNRRGNVITQAWLQDFYANQVVKSKYKELKNDD